MRLDLLGTNKGVETMFRNAVLLGDGIVGAGGNQSEYYDFAEWFYRVCSDDFGRVYFSSSPEFYSGQYCL